MQMSDAGGVNIAHELAGVACCGFDTCDVVVLTCGNVLADKLEVRSKTRGDRNIYYVGLAGKGVHVPERFTQLFGGVPAGGVDRTHAARVADDGCKLRDAKPLHAALNDRILYTEHLCKLCFNHRFFLRFFLVCDDRFFYLLFCTKYV